MGFACDILIMLGGLWAAFSLVVALAQLNDYVKGQVEDGGDDGEDFHIRHSFLFFCKASIARQLSNKTDRIKKTPPAMPVAFLLRLFFGEHILTHGAEGAQEVFGDIFPLSAGSNAAFGVAKGLVVFPAANVTNIFHNGFLLVLVNTACGIVCFSLWIYTTKEKGNLP